MDPPAGLAESDEAADIVVVCVTYNSARVIEALLAALPAALEGVASCRVVVTDNDSNDETVELIRTRTPWVTVLQAGDNVGYAAGINIALRRHPAVAGVYILNPDAVPSPGSVAALHEATLRDRSIGVAVPRVLGIGGDLEPSLRREPTLARALGEALLGGPRTARFPALGEVVRDPVHYYDGATADWATGAALFITRPAVDAVGEWDERFFLYSEETDYCLRVRDAGLRLQLVSTAEVVHQGGDQSTSAGLWALSAVNRTRLYRKRHGATPSFLQWCAVLLNEGLRALAGRPVHRAAVKALLAAGPDTGGTEVTPALLARVGSPVL